MTVITRGARPARMKTAGLTAPADWRDRAACRSEDPETFFPAGDSEAYRDQIREARNICADCPVSEECLAWAIDTNQEHGIWAGTTEHQRRLVRRSRPNSAARAREIAEAAIEEAAAREARAAISRNSRELEALYRSHTTQGDGGHAAWTGTYPTLVHDGQQVTVMQLAFRVGYGRWPDGPVMASCGALECAGLRHQSDLAMRKDEAAWREAGKSAPTTGRTHCPQGHLYSAENTYVYPPGTDRAGHRSCRTCSKGRSRITRERARAKAEAKARA